LEAALWYKARGAFPGGICVTEALQKRNCGSLEAQVEYIRSIGIVEIRFDLLCPPCLCEQGRWLIPTYQQAMPGVLRAIMVNEERWRIRLAFEGIPKCMLRWAGPALSQPLWDYLAEKYLLGSEEPFKLVLDPPHGAQRPREWKNPLKTVAPGCERCRYFDGCKGVWKAYAALHGLQELVAVGDRQAATAI